MLLRKPLPRRGKHPVSRIRTCIAWFPSPLALGTLGAALVLGLLSGSQLDAQDAASEQAPSRFSLAERLDRMSETSPLHYALANRSYDRALAEMVLADDIDAVEPTFGSTALCLAAKDETADAIDMVQALVLKRGADPAVPDAQGLTPLHYAAAGGNLAVVQFLLAHGADVNAKLAVDGAPDITPLFLAYQGQRTRIYDYLMLHGAEDIEHTVKQDLDVQAAIADAMGAVAGNQSDSVDTKAILGALLQSAVGAASAELHEQGRPELVPDIQNWISIGNEVLDTMPPLTADTDRAAYTAEVLRRTMARVAEQSRSLAVEPQ